MRQAFAHEARPAMDADADVAAPGAAITRARCGHWNHPPPCPLAPHHTDARRLGDDVFLCVLFAVDPTLEEAVRAHIEDELAHAERLARA
jgi:hypothetical protein